jgi:tetratricopeptide (TPR) repeat protein
MSWWSRLTGGKSESDSKAGRVDYLSEALALERQGDYDAALTSYRLALRDRPNDQRVLQNMAIAHSRLGQLEEAIRCYRRALEIDPGLGGAHYGLAFLLLKRGDKDGAAEHLQAFLSRPPQSADAERWVRHAQQTLEAMRAPDGATMPPGATPPGGVSGVAGPDAWPPEAPGAGAPGARG